jgi:D-alanine-D-alanine ligase
MSTVAVLAGGPSSEHEVSLDTGREMLAVLADAGQVARPVWIDHDGGWVLGETGEALDALLSREPQSAAEALQQLATDEATALLALHGPFGEDGTVQALLEQAGVPYSGSGPTASELCMDKALSKLAATQLGGRCASHEVIQGGRRPLWGISRGIGYPCVVKPVGAGSSVGVSLVQDEQSIEAAIVAAQAADPVGRCMVEAYIPGVEVSCPVLRVAGEVTTLPCVAIRPTQAFYDYEAKYESDETRYDCPAPMDDATRGEIEALARGLYEGLDLRGVVRLDVILREDDGAPLFLELNTLPGFTSHSLVPMAAREAGMDQARLLELLIEEARAHAAS